MASPLLKYRYEFKTYYVLLLRGRGATETNARVVMTYQTIFKNTSSLP